MMTWEGKMGLFTGILLLFFVSGLGCDLALRHFLKSRKWYGVAPVAAALAAIFLSVYGFSVSAFRCILLCQTLVMAGMVDGATVKSRIGFICWLPLWGWLAFSRSLPCAVSSSCRCRFWWQH